MAEISFQKVFKTYDPGLFKKKVEAVRGMSLSVEKGEVFGLVGPNGAGKSTTIRMLLGLIRADGGAISFRDKPLSLAGIQREIGYLPENPYLYDHLTLKELLEFCGRASGMPAARTEARMEQLLAKVDLAAVRNRRLRTFSKGMLQRAGICFALLHDPSVVVLDEPMSGLDPIGRRIFFDLIMELKGEGKTIFFCSHILSDVERLCDRIGIMVKGRLVQECDNQLFLEERSLPVHLLLGPLTEAQEAALRKIGWNLVAKKDGILLSLGGGELAEALTFLARVGVKVLASRSERFSLEELFLEAVEAHS